LSKTDWATLPEETRQLVQDADGSSHTLNTTRLFQVLQDSKFDPLFWKSLSVQNALRLDFKAFIIQTSAFRKSFGISSVLMPMDMFCTKHKVGKHVAKYMEAQEVDLLVVSFLYINANDGSLRRQVMLCGRETFMDLEPLVQYLMHGKYPGDSLQMEEVAAPTEMVEHANESLSIRYFEQGNAKASRKQLAPIMLLYMDQLNIVG
jgi:DHHA2 domain